MSKAKSTTLKFLEKDQSNRMAAQKSFKEQAASLRAQRGWLTREATDIKALCGIAEATGATIALEDVKRGREKLRERYDRVKNQVTLCTNCRDIKEDDLDKVNADMTADAEEYIKIVKRCAEVAGAIEENQATQARALAAAGAATGGNGGNKCKLNNSLKPPDLTRSFTPAEYRNWRERFRAYYNDSNMAAGSIEVQQQYLMQCLDLDIGSRLGDRTKRTYPLYAVAGGPGSCLEELDNIFKAIHPTPLRRLDLLKMKREPTEEWAAWSARLKAAAREADLDNFDKDDLIALLLMVHSNSAFLDEEFSKMANPSLEDVERVGLVWQRMHAMKGDASAASVQRAEGRGSGGNSSNNSNNSGNNNSSKKKKDKKKNKDRGVSRDSLKGKCFACGSAEHGIKECVNRWSLSCSSCNRKGHKAEVCMSGAKPAEARQMYSEEDIQREQEEYDRKAYYANPPAQAHAARTAPRGLPPLATPAAHARRVRAVPFRKGTRGKAAEAKAARLGPHMPTPPLDA